MYCLMGSNYINENRYVTQLLVKQYSSGVNFFFLQLFQNYSSELRIFEWQHSYFQIIKTIVNQHHNIGSVIVSPINQVILITDAIHTNDIDTIIQVLQYKHVIDDDGDGYFDGKTELQTKRIQNIFVPYIVQEDSLIVYSDKDLKHTHLITCNGNVKKAVLDGMCTAYIWKEHFKARSYAEVKDFNDLNLLKEYLISKGMSGTNENHQLNTRNGIITVQNGVRI